jgi:HEPN domain
VNRAADWLKQAASDLQAARDSAHMGHHEWAAFQAQQCAEKAAKALAQFLAWLSSRGTRLLSSCAIFPTHTSLPRRSWTPPVSWTKSRSRYGTPTDSRLVRQPITLLKNPAAS